MNWFERLLRKYVEHKEIGWAEIGEKFTRYFLVKTRFGNIYLHQLYAPKWHPECHDHPWSFWTILLRRGYTERIIVVDPTIFPVMPVNGKLVPVLLRRDVRRFPGQILWRPATFSHNVITPQGTSWSLIFTGPKSHDWGFKPCERQGMGAGESLSYVKYRNLYKGSVNIR